MIDSRHRKIIQALFVVFCVFVLFVLSFGQVKYNAENDVISNIKVKNDSNDLVISWSLPRGSNISEIIIEISDIDGNFVNRYTSSVGHNSIRIDDLTFNKRYVVTVDGVYKNSEFKQFYQQEYFYYDYNSLRGIPILDINTNSGEDPTATYVEAPEGLWGATSYDNEYLKATMNYSGYGKKLESKLKIKIRGNTSSYSEKKPYKIILDNPLDLTNSGNKYSHSEWILLNTGSTINNFLGETIANSAGVEWVAHGVYVNLILNGDYKGIYTLIEAVSQSDSRGLVNKGGVIFENDAYFWNADWMYFKLYGQIDQMGYTFKYPTLNSSEDQIIFSVYEYMQHFVDLAYSNDESAWGYADLDNFVSYMIAKDLTANGDAGGTNIYYYINDFDSEDQSKRMLKIGPLWDFDTVGDINMNGERFIYNAYSSQHNDAFLPFVNNDEFNVAYWKKWNELSNDILNDIYVSLDELCLHQGKDINQSRYLNSLRWSDGDYQTIEDEVNIAKDWLAKQVEFLNSEMRDK